MTVSYWSLLGTGGLFVVLVMLVLWLWQRRTQDASAVDAGWSACLGVLAVFYAVAAPGDPSRRLLMAFLVGFWAFRLAGYLVLHRVHGKSEDGRYKTLREKWGARAQPYFFILYMAQALLCVVLSVPFLLIAFNPSPDPQAVEIFGVFIWFVALIGETVADRQLAAFRAVETNRGRTCRLGLWKYSRHPNYFFEWLNWCAYALLALAAPFGWLGLVSPIIMLFLVLKVTGIPPNEEQALSSRGEDYREYQRTTSAFVPWFPQKRTS
jgi:steroid 5-alpha reductase family enzyme